MQSLNSSKKNDMGDDSGDFMRVDVKDDELLNFETVEPTLMERWLLNQLLNKTEQLFNV